MGLIFIYEYASSCNIEVGKNDYKNPGHFQCKCENYATIHPHVALFHGSLSLTNGLNTHFIPVKANVIGRSPALLLLVANVGSYLMHHMVVACPRFLTSAIKATSDIITATVNRGVIITTANILTNEAGSHPSGIM